MHDRLGASLRWSIIIILFATGAAKLISSTGHGSILSLPDPLLGASTRVVLVVVGVFELLAVILLSLRPTAGLSFLVTAWLGCNFLLYRLAIAMLHPGLPCPCLGTVPERLNLSTATANRLLVMASIYVLVGSLIMVWSSFSIQQKLMRRILAVDPVRLDI